MAAAVYAKERNLGRHRAEGPKSSPVASNRKSKVQLGVFQLLLPDRRRAIDLERKHAVDFGLVLGKQPVDPVGSSLCFAVIVLCYYGNAADAGRHLTAPL